ncbi:MAG: DSD1 family PLP-dependent enzyme [Desulfobacterales bacterium]|nr:DSD1 family PLP-dependent enzyme [Desulfobacterales bacterium]
MIATIPPAQIGMPLAEVDTPALLIDLDAFEYNLAKMQNDLKDGHARLRPHAKTHKCPVIARQQIDRGAVGVCCQKAGEAEEMVFGGITDVFITNEVVGAQKLKRIAALARIARIAVCADDAVHVTAYDEAARAGQVTLDVFIELDVGANRCGREPGETLLELARQIQTSPHLRFAGLQAYHGSAQHRRTPAERRSAIEFAVSRVTEAKAMLDRHGFSCPTVSGAGTGTYLIEAASGVYDELQAGSYIFMDVDYAKNLGEDGNPLARFQHSLFVYTTVISRSAPDRAVVDAGHKAVPLDSGLPIVSGMKDVEFVRASDEHGKLSLLNPASRLKIGDKLKLIPGHCDPTVNLFDWFVGIRNNRVETLWPITARGAMR